MASHKQTVLPPDGRRPCPARAGSLSVQAQGHHLPQKARVTTAHLQGLCQRSEDTEEQRELQWWQGGAKVYRQ